jgi:hypothetical protein
MEWVIYPDYQIIGTSFFHKSSQYHTNTKGTMSLSLLHCMATIKGSHLSSCTSFIAYSERMFSYLKILAPYFRFSALFFHCLPLTQGTLYDKDSSFRRGGDIVNYCSIKDQRCPYIQNISVFNLLKPSGYCITNTLKLCILPTECMCFVWCSQQAKTVFPQKTLTGLSLQRKRNTFPVRYELNFCILLGRS